MKDIHLPAFFSLNLLGEQAIQAPPPRVVTPPSLSGRVPPVSISPETPPRIASLP